MELELVGPELLLPALPTSTSRQLVRRRSVRDAVTARSQRYRSAAQAASPAPVSAPTSAAKRNRLPPPGTGNIARVQPSSNTTSRIRRDREPQRLPVPKPPRQILSARVRFIIIILVLVISILRIFYRLYIYLIFTQSVLKYSWNKFFIYYL